MQTVSWADVEDGKSWLPARFLTTALFNEH